MRIVVDHDLCEGHGKCEQSAPKVFDLRDDDLSYVQLDPVPEEHRKGVERAVRICPRGAISIVEGE